MGKPYPYNSNVLWFNTKHGLDIYYLNLSFFLVLKVKWCSSREGLWVTATDGGTVCTWDPLTAAPLNTMNHMGQAVTALLVDDANEVILLCTVNDNLIHMFKLTLQNEICTYSGHNEQVHAMVYLDNRKQYLSSSWDLTLCVWLGPHKDPKLVNDQVPVGDAKVITINPLLWFLYLVYSFMRFSAFPYHLNTKVMRYMNMDLQHNIT